MLTVAIIGCGNMGAAIFGGLLRAGYDEHELCISNRSRIKLETLTSSYTGITVTTTENNREAIKDKNIIILAVKPNCIQKVCEEIHDHLTTDATIISVAAGVTIASIQKWLGGNQSHTIVRAMPNTPCLLGAGATVLSGKTNKVKQKNISEIFSHLGQVTWLDNEDTMHTATATSGSGPAYFFRMADSMIQAATQQGLTHQAAHELVVQTLYGAARMLQESTHSPAELQTSVTSPNGTTAAAGEIFDSYDFTKIIQEAMTAATERSKQIAHELDPTS